MQLSFRKNSCQTINTMKKDKIITSIRDLKTLPLYLRNADIDVIIENFDNFYSIKSNNNAYQTEKHHRIDLYKQIILLNEKI